jgi:hypothetical protein
MDQPSVFTELQSSVTCLFSCLALQTKAHPDLPRTKEQWGLQDPGQDKISTRAELVRILVTIAWTASAHHAAVNFGQYDNTSYPLNAPTIVRKPMPNDPKGAGWRVSARSAAWQQQRQFSLASKRECLRALGDGPIAHASTATHIRCLLVGCCWVCLSRQPVMHFSRR